MNITPSRTVWLCGLLMSLTAFSTDITLPLFGGLATDLGAPIERIPLTVTFFMLSMGAGQLIFGCLSDKYGRRHILMIGLLIFMSGTVLALLANSLQMLILARAIQGFGAAAAHILSRAIIRDFYSGTELAKKMAIATGIFSVGPIMAPLLGAVVLVFGGGWQWVFVLMLGYCATLLVLVRQTTESNKNRNANATNLLTVSKNIKTVIGTQQSRYFISITAIISVSLLLIVSTSPSVYAKAFDITGVSFALYYAVHGIGIILGQYANHRLIGRVGIVPTSIIATIVMLLGALSISVCALTDLLSPWAVSLCITIFALGFMGVVANATSLLLHSHGEIIGFTAALQGTITMLFSGLVAGLLSVFVQDNIVTWGLAIAVGPVLVLILLARWHAISTQTA